MGHGFGRKTVCIHTILHFKVRLFSMEWKWPNGFLKCRISDSHRFNFIFLGNSFFFSFLPPYFLSFSLSLLSSSFLSILFLCAFFLCLSSSHFLPPYTLPSFFPLFLPTFSSFPSFPSSPSFLLSVPPAFLYSSLFLPPFFNLPSFPLVFPPLSLFLSFSFLLSISRQETLGFQFWRQGYWADHLRGKPYHISAIYVVDLKRFR